MPTFPLDTGGDVRDKIDWEGGIWNAFNWGLAADELPEKYRDEGRTLASLYEELDGRAAEFYARLPPENEDEDGTLLSDAGRLGPR